MSNPLRTTDSLLDEIIDALNNCNREEPEYYEAVLDLRERLMLDDEMPERIKKLGLNKIGYDLLLSILMFREDD